MDRVLNSLAAGNWDDDESSLVDLKEEAGRRDKTGNLLPGQPRNEKAAIQVAAGLACAANTPGGAALVLGVADDGSLLGAALDIEWLRHRVYELTDRTLTIDVRAAQISGVRVLVIVTVQESGAH